MPVTKTYVRYGGEKAGRTLYDASPYRYVFTEDGEAIDHDEFDKTRTFPNLGIAKKWIAERIVQLGPEWKGRIVRGCYRNEDFTDPGYGHILDAYWDEDDRWYIDVWQDEPGRVDFEEYDG